MADSDGQVSPCVHPGATWREMVASQPRWDLKVRATKHWLQRRLFRGRREDLARIESTRHSDRLVFGTERARENFRRLLAYYDQDGLASRLAVVPYPVNEAFCERPIPARKRHRIVAVARWDSPQKDAELMAAALRTYLEQGGQAEIVLIGRGGVERFTELARRFPQVTVVGVRPPEEVVALLAESRSIVFSSRWESGPIAGVGDAGARRHHRRAADSEPHLSVGRRPLWPHQLNTRAGGPARAISDEMRAWDQGQRDPVGIAVYWRTRVSPAAVCNGLLAGLPVVRESSEALAGR